MVRVSQFEWIPQRHGFRVKEEELQNDEAGPVPEKLDEHSGDRTSGPGRQGHQGTARVLQVRNVLIFLSVSVYY